MNFELGDRVKCISRTEGKETIIGCTGTIIGFQGGNKKQPCVEFDAPFNGGHQGLPFNGQNSRCWNFWNDVKSLVLVEAVSKDTVIRTSLERKCRKLWNQSNYVKNNPKYAY